MTLPLETYDPDWEEKLKAIRIEIVRTSSLPDTIENWHLVEKLKAREKTAIESQFLTTSDYAQWAKTQLEQRIKFSSLPEYFKLPLFSLSNSMEITRELFEQTSSRILYSEFYKDSSMPTSYPTGEEAFAFELPNNATRKLGFIIREHEAYIHSEDGLYAGTKPAATMYMYVLEKRHSTVNVCFLGFGSEAGSLTHDFVVSELANTIYQSELAPNAQQARNDAYHPEEINFYTYFPLGTIGRELHHKLELWWHGEDDPFGFKNEFSGCDFTRLKAVPYYLKKLAASEGLAQDPGPHPPAPKGSDHTPEINNG